MRVLAINQFYAPDQSATSQMLTELCEDLVSAGHAITVIASPGRYLGGPRLPPRETISGVRVVRPWATSFGKRTVAGRLADYASFWATSVAQAAATGRPDIILALTTPPLISVAAALVAAARNVPLVTWVQDVYPDLAIELGVLARGGIWAAQMAEISRRVYRSSRYVVALSGGMADRLAARGAPRDRLRVVPNWADGKVLRPISRETNHLLGAAQLRDRFIVMYSGNLGVGHDVKTIIEAARHLEPRCPHVLFLFVGEGARRLEAERLATGLGNVRFQSYQPREHLAESLCTADVQLVTLQNGLEGLLVPSKFYAAIACGRPVFYVGPAECEVARAVARDDLGWVGGPGDSVGLARAIEKAASTPSWSVAREQRIRRVFLDSYDRPIGTAKWGDLLVEAAAPERRAVAATQAT
jgi:glycosyltransferase involved in cell wall biosynthesis